MNRCFTRAVAAVTCVLSGFGRSADGADPRRSLDGAFTVLEAMPEAVRAGAAWVRPEAFASVRVDWPALRQTVGRAPLEDAARPGVREGASILLMLPDPEGRFEAFRVVESPVMEPGLAAQFPEIKTYLGQGVDDPAAVLRFDTTPQGFHAQVLTPRGDWYIDPYTRAETVFVASYHTRDLKPTSAWSCSGPVTHAVPFELRGGAAGGGTANRSGPTLRTYRLANACTGEYAAFHGGTVALAQAAIVTAINRVTGVYEKEVAIRLTLVAANTSIVFTNAGTDPYTNTDGATMLGQNQTRCDSAIGAGNYDIGHVFSTGGGGIAGLGVVCRAGNKARGVTGLPSPTGDAFYIDYVAHEMGHQFGGDHTFNSVTDSCGGGNRNGPTAYEPGSGSTIMPYAGICGADDLQAHSDAYFHSISFDEIIAYTTTGLGNGCPTTASTGNTQPTVSAGSAFTIPKGTPFALTATGSDPNGDALTYCWEERDTGPAAALTAADDGQIPLNRSRNPTTSPVRLVPPLANILAGTVNGQDRLPAIGRVYAWRVTARDNRAGGGGVNTSDVTMTVSNTAGPFAITSQSSAVTWPGLSSQTVTWSVNGTSALAANVKISYSTDGGNTFPTILAASVPNNGSAVVTAPNVATPVGRVKVEAVGNIFFDINNASITSTTVVCNAPSITGQPAASNPCPGSPVTFTVTATGTGLTYQWRKGGAVIGGATAPSYTIAAAAAGDVGSYDVVVTGACGSATSNAAALTLRAAPSITSPPTSRTACVGTSTTYTVAASGTAPLSYQWFAAGSAVAGATSASYTETVAAGAPADRWVVVTNACGSATSAHATLTPTVPPVVTAGPDQVACPGGSATLTASVAGTGPFTYAWRHNGVVVGVSASLTVNPVDGAAVGQYTLTATGPCGTGTGGAITLTAPASAFTIQPPSSLQLHDGAALSLTVAYTGQAPLTVRWRRGGVDLADGGRVSGSASATLTVTGVTGAESGLYDAVVTSPCGPITSTPAAVSVECSPLWSQVSTAGPGARWGQVFVYDDARRATLFFGGEAGPYGPPTDLRADTWTWDGSAWESKAAAGPGARTLAGAACDTARSRVVLFGGSGAGGTLLNDTWEWDGAAWAPAAPAASPSARSGAAMAYDSARQRVVLFGGTDALGAVGETWEFDGAAWVPSAAAGPSPRGGCQMAFDAARAVCVLWGGSDGPTRYTDTWEYDGTAWTQRSATLAGFDGARARMVYDTALARVLLTESDLGALSAWDGSAWTPIGPAGAPAGIRAYGGLAYDSNRDAVVVHGGTDPAGAGPTLGDTWERATGLARVTLQPAPVTVDAGQTAVFTLTSSSVTAQAVQWRYGGVALTDGPRPGGSTVSGSATPTLTVATTSIADAGGYDASITNFCGVVLTAPATLTVRVGNPCPADWNADGEVNGNDISDYINSWYGDVLGGSVVADFNGDGETNGNDISDYINAWYAAVLNGGFC